MQVHDTVESVKQIGLAATLVFILLGTVGLMLRWAAKRLDKKDDQILKITDERHEDLARMVESQRLVSRGQERMVESQELVSRGQEKIVEALTGLADEMRRRKKR